jgi:glutamine synthetase
MKPITELFGENVFNDAVMRARLPKATYKALQKTIVEGKTLDKDVAEVVANAMKDWAIEKGATHYTHWFQPMTGTTAEKHDSFISPTPEGKVVLEFSGKELSQGEPDASSFPNGGIRATFEARGYTAWDCTSPAFIKKEANGSTTLCIPTVFCSYTGEALDKKTPLLRSMQALAEQAARILKLFGSDAQRVITTVGPEQEYFLIDKEHFKKRRDLVYTGRTLFGAPSPKGQELDDHYFGAIKERVSGYMKELNEELWKLGVAAKTQHNEVAPAQFEMAPIFSTTNVATDNNQLVMETMKKVADRHGLACLLHEKPFAGINGSGKHNNWSMSTDTGVNLLEPGKTPHDNQQFLVFLAAIVKAVDTNSELLRMSAATVGNDHRLGANEAPPAIISMFVGSQLAEILEQIESGRATSSKESGKLEFGVTTLPELPKDVTDRNRTSPFAFTGNKFEFRMVGSTASIAGPNTVLNTIVANVLDEFATILEGAEDLDTAIVELLTKTIKQHKRIIFNGDNYSADWVVEAERRGLPNIKSMVEAVPYLASKKSKEMFIKYGVLSDVEIDSRVEILLEIYAKNINIEAKTMLDMAKTQILPAAIKYAGQVAGSIAAIKAAGLDADVSMVSELTDTIAVLKANIMSLGEAIEKAQAVEEVEEQAVAFRDIVFPAMIPVRESADLLETMVARDVWPIPTYGEMLFSL